MWHEVYPRIKGSAWARPWRSWRAVHLFLSQNMCSVKIFFLISCIAFFFFSAQTATYQEEPIVQEEYENYWNDTETATLPKYFKYILLWTWKPPGMYAPFYKRGAGQETFTAINCLFTQCYVTANRRLFKGDLTKFDAVLFDGKYLDASDLPWQRSRYQQYIFFSMESAYNYPVCKEVFDGFFNLTSTYRLDSDIPYPYILIRDKNGKIVGPKRKMVWKKMPTANDKLVQITLSKAATAIWFVSNCRDRNGRRKFVTKLQNALIPYNLTLDVFGKCGTMQCPRNFQSVCNRFIKKEDYYFYMSLENSFAEDYVTEKLLTALQNDVVPIVYGGADYTRFLPPGSYIDARKHSITELAAKMNKLIHSPKEYIQYFWWKKYYSFHDPTNVENVCAICEALHSEETFNTTRSYYHFRDWWNPNNRCDATSEIPRPLFS